MLSQTSLPTPSVQDEQSVPDLRPVGFLEARPVAAIQTSKPRYWRSSVRWLLVPFSYL
jgi:hypothetical protein